LRGVLRPDQCLFEKLLGCDELALSPFHLTQRPHQHRESRRIGRLLAIRESQAQQRFGGGWISVYARERAETNVRPQQCSPVMRRSGDCDRGLCL
jgi:hypothetical protein